MWSGSERCGAATSSEPGRLITPREKKTLGKARGFCYAVFAFVALVSPLGSKSGRKVTLAAYFFAW
jgi:hypothetical protein